MEKSIIFPPKNAFFTFLFQFPMLKNVIDKNIFKKCVFWTTNSMTTLFLGSFFAPTTKVIFSCFFNYFAFIVKKYNKNKIKIFYFYYVSIFQRFFRVFSLVAIPCFFDKIPKKLIFPRKKSFYKKTAEIKRNHQIPELKMIVGD